MAAHLTSCPRNCYSTCSLVTHVEDGRIRRIEPHPGNLATPEGACLKGLSYFERQHSPDRILHPLRRDPGSGSFRRISWDDALDTITEQLLRARREHGPQSVLFYAGSGTKGLLNGVSMNFWRLFGGCTTTYGDLCWPAGLEATRLTLGANKHNAPQDLENARLIVMWGKNPAETNIHQTVFINRAIEAGARLVVIDPRRTQSCEQAELHIQPRPGTDGAIALAVANRLIEQGDIDRDFLAAHVLGFEEFAASVADWTTERAARIAGVSVDSIERLASWIGEHPPVTINCGYGMQRYTNSGQTMRAILALVVLTGNLGKPGAGWIFANLQSAVFDSVQDPIAFYPPEQPDGVVRIAVSTARLGPEMLALEDPPLRVAWCERGNPLTQNPQTNLVVKAFRALDFRVVVDQFLTDTAREADIVLPAKTLFEQSDVIGAYWHGYLQIKKKLLEPPGEVRPETDIYRALARRLDIDPAVIEEQLPGESDEAIDAYLRRRLAEVGGPTLEELEQAPRLAPDTEEIAFADRVFATPSGRIELVSGEAVERWGVDRLPTFAEPTISTARPSKQTERFPLYLLTPNTKNRIHSQFGNLQMIRAVADPPQVSMHPRDAAAREIAEGDEVRVHNDRGELVMRTRLERSIRPGCVSITNGWWQSDGGPVNQLSAALETDMAHGAAFHDTLVEVTRL